MSDAKEELDKIVNLYMPNLGSPTIDNYLDADKEYGRKDLMLALINIMMELSHDLKCVRNALSVMAFNSINNGDKPKNKE